MDGLEQMQGNFELAIERNDSSKDGEECRPTVDDKPQTLREKLDPIIHSHRFMVGVMVLVLVDCLMVIVEILFDLEIVKLGEEHEFIPEIFHYGSLAILSIFLVEISIRMFVMRLEFFHHKLEVFDAVVVIVSFVLDIVFLHHKDATVGIGLLIILRLWRVARVINGIVLTAQKRFESRLEKEQQTTAMYKQEVSRYFECCKEQDLEIESLLEVVQKHGIVFIASKITKPDSFATLGKLESHHSDKGMEPDKQHCL